MEAFDSIKRTLEVCDDGDGSCLRWREMTLLSGSIVRSTAKDIGSLQNAASVTFGCKIRAWAVTVLRKSLFTRSRAPHVSSYASGRSLTQVRETNSCALRTCLLYETFHVRWCKSMTGLHSNSSKVIKRLKINLGVYQCKCSWRKHQMMMSPVG
jgi:hypothetical protein